MIRHINKHLQVQRADSGLITFTHRLANNTAQLNTRSQVQGSLKRKP